LCSCSARRSARTALAILRVLSALAIFWVVGAAFAAFEHSHPIAIRSTARWLVWSGEYKTRVLEQAPAANGELKHIEWDGWGMFAQDTSVYLVFDPADSLSAAARSHQAGKFDGIPCKVFSVRRMEDHWYAVVDYTGQAWGQCS
jgi:hypothetical protein